MKYQTKIVEQVCLANDFVHITCPSPYAHAAPGHFIWIKEEPVYLLGHTQNELEFILPASLVSSPLVLSEIHGTPFSKPEQQHFYLLLVENNALSACLFYLKKYRALFRGIVFIGTDTGFPFYPCPSRHLLEGIPPSVIAALPLLDDWGIAHRLATRHEQPGCFEGTAAELAHYWIQNNKTEESVTQIFPCLFKNV